MVPSFGLAQPGLLQDLGSESAGIRSLSSSAFQIKQNAYVPQLTEHLKWEVTGAKHCPLPCPPMRDEFCACKKPLQSKESSLSLPLRASDN